MRIVTINVNGIRAAGRKGFFNWLRKKKADVVCIQETRAQVNQLSNFLYHPEGYHCFYHSAERKGYSGVALYCSHKPDNVIVGMSNKEFDTEGRYIEAEFGNLSVASIYMPSGSSQDKRQLAKYRCMAHMMEKLKDMKALNRNYVLAGDWNIAHKNEDIRNWRGNQNNSGFLREERSWLDTIFDKVGFVDAFRELDQKEHSYTWWSNRGQAWIKNIGWRIDYQVLSPNLKGTVLKTEIYTDERFSDHAPLTIDYNY